MRIQEKWHRSRPQCPDLLNISVTHPQLGPGEDEGKVRMCTTPSYSCDRAAVQELRVLMCACASFCCTHARHAVSVPIMQLATGMCIVRYTAHYGAVRMCIVLPYRHSAHCHAHALHSACVLRFACVLLVLLYLCASCCLLPGPK